MSIGIAQGCRSFVFRSGSLWTAVLILLLGVPASQGAQVSPAAQVPQGAEVSSGVETRTISRAPAAMQNAAVVNARNTLITTTVPPDSSTPRNAAA